ncbi:MAG: LCP family protein [Clostridia bacterium]|nr:LCP family protein [Clostridia bacterium]
MQTVLQMLQSLQQLIRRRSVRFLGAASVFLVLFLAVSAVYIGLHSGGFSRKETTETQTETDSTQPLADVSGVKNLLLLCATPEKTDIRMLCVVQINFDEKLYSVCAFSPREGVNTGERFGSFLEHYQSGGVKQLIRAVEKISGIHIDRYIASDDNTFKRAVNSMGPIVLSFPKQINYRGEDFAIVLIEGEQKLRGDDLLKYMRYCGAIGEEGLQMQARAVGEMFLQYITEKNLEKKDNLYSSLIGTLTSDISVMDFKKSGNMLEYMQRNPFEVQDIQYFRIIPKEEVQR